MLITTMEMENQGILTAFRFRVKHPFPSLPPLTFSLDKLCFGTILYTCDQAVPIVLHSEVISTIIGGAASQEEVQQRNRNDECRSHPPFPLSVRSRFTAQSASSRTGNFAEPQRSRARIAFHMFWVESADIPRAADAFR